MVSQRVYNMKNIVLPTRKRIYVCFTIYKSTQKIFNLLF